MTFTPPPSIGPFAFPVPYGTRGIRLTNPSNAPRGCPPRLYPYHSIINNHRGQASLYAFVGRVGMKPLLLTVIKATGAIQAMRELPMDGEAEGWYFSDTLPTAFYFLEGAQLRRHDAFDGRTQTVCTLDPKYGDNLWQAHSSADDQVHSATVRRRTSEGEYPKLGVVVFRKGQQRFFGIGHHDECQVDKRGRYLVVQKDHHNYITDLDTDELRVITNEEGALAHLDVGAGFMVGEDDQHEPSACVLWDLTGPTPRRLLHSTRWGPGMGHCAVRGQTVLLSSNATQELILLSLAYRAHTDYQSDRLVAPGMIAGDPKHYDFQLRACLDPTGQFGGYLTNLGSDGGPFHAFLVEMPGAPIVVHPPPPPDPKPTEPGGSMKPFPYFTSAEKVEFEHDRGFRSTGVPGTFDGRPAHILPTLDTLPEREGAWMTLTWANGKRLRQHGRFYLKQEPDRATFSVDMTEEPTGF